MLRRSRARIAPDPLVLPSLFLVKANSRLLTVKLIALHVQKMCWAVRCSVHYLKQSRMIGSTKRRRMPRGALFNLCAALGVGGGKRGCRQPPPPDQHGRGTH